jgi:hypothetical protein
MLAMLLAYLNQNTVTEADVRAYQMSAISAKDEADGSRLGAHGCSRGG